MIQTRIHRADRADLAALLTLESRFPEADRISRASFLRLLKSPSCDILLATRVSVLGAAIVLYRRNRSLARLYSISVHQSALGTGLGRLLLDASIHAAKARKCDRMRLEVRASNQSAIRLYRRADFAEIGVRQAYYEDGEDALIMERDLSLNMEHPND